MMWLCIRLPQLAHEALAGVAVAAFTARSRSSAPERALAIRREALERLAAWAYQWSSRVSYDPHEPLLWLELGASCGLFEGLESLLARLRAELVLLGYTHVCALAPSPTAAALLTRADEPRHVRSRTELRQRLESLPLHLLALPVATLAALRACGLRRIGQVLELGATAIARRFGPETQLYLQRLCAQTSDPRPAWRLPPTYGARCEFDGEVHTTSALLFPLRRMLLEFQGYLRARDCGVLRFTLEFEHHRRPVSRTIIGSSAPGRDAAQFLTLVRERLHSLALPAPVNAVRLQALEFTSPAIVQASLFGNDAQPLQELRQLLDRLRARLGESSVHALQPQADYRPERGSRLVALEAAPEPHAVEEPRAPEPAPPRPCWLLSQPLRIGAPARLLRGPERIESGWWDQGEVRRDYYLARSDEGAHWWVFRDRRDGVWYLQGLWA
ncbi:MAG TPA: DNA polymerase Y family protein [Steroidobacteraceae bacterium]